MDIICSQSHDAGIETGLEVHSDLVVENRKEQKYNSRETSYDRRTKKLISDLCYDFDLKYDIFPDTQFISEDELKNGIRGKHPVFQIAINEGLHA